LEVILRTAKEHYWFIVRKVRKEKESSLLATSKNMKGTSDDLHVESARTDWS